MTKSVGACRINGSKSVLMKASETKHHMNVATKDQAKDARIDIGLLLMTLSSFANGVSLIIRLRYCGLNPTISVRMKCYAIKI